MAGIRLIVGLGNPGREYADTRHNAGFLWVETLARSERIAFKSEGKFHGLTARLSRHEHEIWLLLPQTYMNASGRSVAALAKFYKITTDELLVVHDELDLNPGTARLKRGGGHGGHNGLRDIAANLGNDFWRLRLGIAHPGDKNEVVNYVLNPPRREESALLEEAIARSLRVLPLIEAGDFAAAMQQLHTHEKKTTGNE